MNDQQQPAIRFERVSVAYPGADSLAVDAVSLDIQPGELVVLLGPSGCGKTTLLKVVNRLIEPTSGEIYVNGVPASSVPAPELRRQIGYVIQQTGLFPHMRVGANVAVVPKLLGWDRGRTRERVDELLELVGLSPEEYRDRYPAQLSGGQQQRVGLARALAGDPDMILMDEPFGALDAITRTRLQDELGTIQRQLQRTILFVTHDIEEAVKLADRIVVMNAGVVEQFDEPLRIILEPASPFVAELVGASDIVRRLSLIEVGSIARPPGELNLGSGDAIPAKADVRSALNRMLGEGVESLRVVDEDGCTVGIIEFDHIRSISAEPIDVQR